MKTRFSLTQLALATTWAGIFLAYWPVGCAHPDAARSATGSTDAAQAPLTDRLVHPAFAYAQAPAAGGASIADIAERVTPSVVSVATRQRVTEPDPQSDLFFRFFGPMAPSGPRTRQGLGSGVIVSADGVVLTNNHVVEGADQITVTVADGRELEATVVGTDSESDVAVLRLKGETKNLVPIKYGDSTGLRVGDVVLAIGNPFGVGQTVTMGIVSAKDRSNPGIVNYSDFIQTDAAINPGNSGGALVNMRGELVGINTAIISKTGGYQGIGLAIPVSMAKPISEALLKDGRVVRGFLGVGIQDVDSDLANAMNLTVHQGVLINSVTAASPADKAGIKQGDVVTTFEGQEVKGADQFRNRVAAAGANRKVNLEVLRDGKRLTVSVLLEERPNDGAQRGPAPAENAGSPQGLRLQPLDPNLRARLGVPPDRNGVVVARVAPDSSAATSGLQPGDVILEANRKPVASVADLEKQFASAGPGGVALLVMREGGTRFLVLKK